MFRQFVFYDSSSPIYGGAWTAFLFPGLFFCFFGFSILVMPELLAALVAMAFMTFGILFLFLAFKTRQFNKRHGRWRNDLW